MALAAPAADQQNKSGAWTVLKNTVVPFLASTTIDSVARGVVIPVLPAFALSLGSNSATTGMLVACTGIGRIVANVPVGMLITHFKREKWVWVGGFLVYVLSGSLAAASRSTAPLAIATVLGGVSVACTQLCRQGLVAARVPNRYRGRSNSLFGGFSRIGTAVGPAAGGYIALHIGYRAAFLFTALLALLAAGLVILAHSYLDCIDSKASGTGNDTPIAATASDAPTTAAAAVGGQQRGCLCMQACGVGVAGGPTTRRFAATCTFVACLNFLRNARDLLLPLAATFSGFSVAQTGAIVTVRSAPHAASAAALLVHAPPAKTNIDHILSKIRAAVVLAVHGPYDLYRAINRTRVLLPASWKPIVAHAHARRWATCWTPAPSHSQA